MTVSRMSNAEMLSVLESWLGEHRKTFESFPKWKVLLEDLEGVRSALRTLAPAGWNAGDAQTIAALTKEIDRWDSRHDTKLRACVTFLEALVEDAESAEETAAYVEARRVLFPNGGAGSAHSFIAEAGNATRAKENLAKPENKAIRDTLKAVHTGRGKRTLYDVVEDYIEAGERLGALDAQRTAREAALRGDPGASEATPPIEVRGQWLAITKDVVRMARNAADGRREAIRSALSVFEKAVERASHRGRGGTAEAGGGGENAGGKASEGAKG